MYLAVIKIIHLVYLFCFSPHPYVFFNGDPDSENRHSMTFIGFNVGRNGDIIDPKTTEILDRNVISPELQNALTHNHVQLNEDFDQLPRYSIFKLLVCLTKKNSYTFLCNNNNYSCNNEKYIPIYNFMAFFKQVVFWK